MWCDMLQGRHQLRYNILHWLQICQYDEEEAEHVDEHRARYDLKVEHYRTVTTGYGEMVPCYLVR